MSPTTSAPQKSLRIGVLSAIGQLDPREAGDTISGLILGQTFEMPYVMTPAGGLEPCLFDGPLRMERNGAQPVYSAGVRPGIVFSDGTPLTPENVATSLSKTKAIRGRATVTARDGRVLFTMSGPYPRFENVLSQWNTAIVLERQGTLLGTGPYVLAPGTTLAAVKAAGMVRMERNPRYRSTAHIDELLFVIYQADADGTPNQLIAAARRGDIDMTLNLSASDLVNHGISGYQAMLQPSNSTSILYFNSEKPHLKDVNLRRALQHALNITPVAEINYEKNHLAFVANDIIPPLMGKVGGAFTMRDRELLRAYTPKPSMLSMVVPWSPRPYLPKPLPSAQEIERQLAAYGIQLRLIVTKSAEDFFGTLALGEYDLAMAGWVADNPDPAEFYESLLSSAQVSTRHQYMSNLARWKTAEMDAALVAYRANPSPENRKVITGIIEREAILVPLVYGASTAIRSRKVRNVNISPAGHVAFADVDISVMATA